MRTIVVLHHLSSSLSLSMYNHDDVGVGKDFPVYNLPTQFPETCPCVAYSELFDYKQK